MHYAVLGELLILTWIEKAPKLRRHLYDNPRRRRKQGPRTHRFACELPRLS
jgi:hypothetical protein